MTVKWYLEEFLLAVSQVKVFEEQILGMLSKADKLVLKRVIKEVERVKKLDLKERSKFEEILAQVGTVEGLKKVYKIVIF